jgi:hypothetical protein
MRSLGSGLSCNNTAECNKSEARGRLSDDWRFCTSAIGEEKSLPAFAVGGLIAGTKDPHSAMPAFPEYDAATLRALVAYFQTFITRDKP